MKMSAGSVVLGVCLAAGALAACDGDSSGEGLSKAEYVERGDAICRRLETEGESVAVPPQEAPLEAHVAFVEDVLALMHPARDDFEALAAPEGDTAAKERFDGYWERVTSTLERARDAAAGGERQEYEDAIAALQEDESLAEDFRDYGFEVCGNT
ncbi:MAG: hypothetical protein ABR613_11575 [Actinomycetota bacterium]